MKNFLIYLSILAVWLLIWPLLAIGKGFKQATNDCQYLIKVLLEDTESGQDEPW